MFKLSTLTSVAVFLALPGVSFAATPEDMPARTWLEIPNSKLESVGADPEKFAGINGNTGIKSVVGAWNSAALDTKRSRLILHGGGHADYFGNEIYVFEVETLTWRRLTDPTANPTAGSDINWDGTPQSRHTYGGTTYIAHRDSFFVFGGAGSTIDSSGFPPTENVWTFDFGAATWSHVSSVPDGPPHKEGSVAVYDPVTRIVWWGEGWNSNPDDGWGLWAYDPDTKKWTHHTHSSVFSGSTGCLDTKRGLLVTVGSGGVRAFDVRKNPATETEWKTTGAMGILDKHVPGVDYDPVADRIVAWGGGPVYVLDPETKVWTQIDAAGAPQPNQNGTYRRFAYVPSVNAFASINETNVNVFFFKHTAGMGEPLPDAGATPEPDAGNAGTGGVAGAGGTTAQPGTGGKPASSGTGGKPASSGTGGKPASSGSGGKPASSGSGGAPTSSESGGASAGAAPESSSDGGCGCRLSAATRRDRYSLLLTIVVSAFALSRRRRRAPT